MKKKIGTLFVVVMVIMLVASNALCASAAENAVVSVKFDANGDFAAMGDLDQDGKFAATDLTMFRKKFLGDESTKSKYCDVNGDTIVNAIDLVCLKKYIGKNAVHTKFENNTLTIDGTAYYTGEFVSLLKANTEYQIKYNFTSNQGIDITIKGVADSDLKFNSKSGSNMKSYSHVFKTDNTLSTNSGLELSIAGKGTIDNITIYEITDKWTDSDNLEQGANDVF